MPHQCTNCGHTFADGSKEMLSGCPGCGGNTFQFHPKGTEVPDDPPDGTEATPPEPEGGGTANTVGRAATKVRDFVGTGSDAGPGDGDPARDPGDPSLDEPDPSAPWPDDLEDGTDDPAGDAEIIDADARRTSDDEAGNTEDVAQSSARTDVAGPDELAAGADDTLDSGGAEAATESGGAGTTAEPGGSGAPEPGDGRVVSEPSDEEPGIEELREQLNDQFESIKIVEPGQYELNLMELFDREEYIIALQENGRYVIQVPENWIGDGPGD